MSGGGSGFTSGGMWSHARRWRRGGEGRRRSYGGKGGVMWRREESRDGERSGGENEGVDVWSREGVEEEGGTISMQSRG